MKGLLLTRFKLNLRQRVENILKRQIINGHGIRDCTDLKKAGCQISTIFDVGANIGQSAVKFKTAFPESTIYCFEPVNATFNRLLSNVDADANIYCYEIALGSKNECHTIFITEQCNTCSLIKSGNIIREDTVEVCTMDNFVIKNNINRIDLLKIDTEGFDLEVLKGAQKVLASGGVSFVLTEVGFHPGDRRHVLFDEMRDFLIPLGFFVFGIYDQQPDFPEQKRLRYANVCFCNENAMTVI